MSIKLYNRNKFLYNFIWLISTILIVAFDQITKCLVVDNMQLYDEITVIKGFFKLYYVRNSGAGLGLFANARWVFLTFTTIVIIIAIFLLIKNYFDHILAYISLVFILGGGIGNMIDRVFIGEVVDFFQFQIKFFDFIFNVADVFVTFGTVLFVIYYLLYFDKNKESADVAK